LQFFALRAAKLHFSAVAVAKLKFCNSLYEKDLLFSPCRVEIEEAYNTNMARINNGDETTSGIKRETRVLALLKEIYGNQGR
jgi:hypothetical protein